MRSRLSAWVGGALLWLLAGPAAAVLSIEITRGLAAALPIAVVPFAWSGPGPAPGPVAEVVAADLARSGRFSPLPVADMPERPSDFAEVRFADWRRLGMENLVVGRVTPAGDDRLSVEFRLIDVFRARQLLGLRMTTPRERLRFTAHRIADAVYEQLTGEPGVFSTRIAYVAVTGEGEARRYRLQVADADGHDPRTLLVSPEPLLSPAWSPDGTRIAYVSFEGGNSAVYVQEVASGERRRVSAGPGINSAPAFSPDGRRLAVTLSRGRNPELYLIDLATGRLERLTRDPAIDTEPAFSPDGATVVFTSDRGGGPQLYALDLASRKLRRLTFGHGSYNASAQFSPDGRRLVLVTNAGGGYRIALMELATGAFEVITDGPLDESPSFAPNGSMILYTAAATRGSELAAVSADGRVRQRLKQEASEVREPAWGPMPR